MSLPSDIMADRGIPAGFPWERVAVEEVVDVAPAAPPIDCSVRMAAMEFAVRLRADEWTVGDVIEAAGSVLAFLEGRG